MSAPARYTLAAKFALLFGTFAVAAGALICSITYVSYRGSMLEHYGRYAIGAATLAASVLEPEELLRYADTPARDERYAALEKELDRIRKSLGVRYLYVQMPVSDAKYMYLFDLYDPEDAGGPDTSLGAYGDYDENFRAAKLAMSTGRPVRELDITVSKYGYLASAYVPIRGKDSIPFAYVGVDISMNSILVFLRRYLAVIVSATAAVMALCFTSLFFLVRRSVARPIRMIAEKTGEFTRRVSDASFEELSVPSKDEIGDLSASVNTMFREIRDFASRLAAETAHRERIQSELDMAKGIQESVLPKKFPPFHNLTGAAVFAAMLPAKEVGGDFYDFFVVGEERLAVVIGDVSGKGVPAALFMMVARTLIKHESFAADEPCKLLETVNNRLCENNEAGMFVTLFVGMLDMKRNILRYANGGHNPPVMLRNGRAFWLPVNSGMALGVMENMEFVTQETPFEEGDLLLLYTDGVTEAMNDKKELFGNGRLIELLSAKAEETPSETIRPEELIGALREAIGSFAGDAEQADDITMLALLKTGK